MPCLADDRDLDLDLAVSGLGSLAEVLEGRESAEDFWVLPWGFRGFLGMLGFWAMGLASKGRGLSSWLTNRHQFMKILAYISLLPLSTNGA